MRVKFQYVSRAGAGLCTEDGQKVVPGKGPISPSLKFVAAFLCEGMTEIDFALPDIRE